MLWGKGNSVRVNMKDADVGYAWSMVSVLGDSGIKRGMCTGCEIGFVLLYCRGFVVSLYNWERGKGIDS